jgi:hypothetical protein
MVHGAWCIVHGALCMVRCAERIFPAAAVPKVETLQQRKEKKKPNKKQPSSGLGGSRALARIID